jgi:hypothetical protein
MVFESCQQQGQAPRLLAQWAAACLHDAAITTHHHLSPSLQRNSPTLSSLFREIFVVRALLMHALG